MAEVEDQILPHVCSIFESQTWRRSLCKNCFHTLDEHSEELLAKEAEEVAKEKVAMKISTPGTKKPAVINAKNSSLADAKNIKRTGSSRESKGDKEKSPKEVKEKVVTKDSIKEDDKLSLKEDTGPENKTTKPGTLSKTSNEKHPTTSSTTPGSSPSSSIAKSPPKNVKPTAATPVTARSSQTVTSNSINSAASGTNSATNPQKISVSRAKNPTLTSEQMPIPSKDKLSKPSDMRTKNSSILPNSTKTTNTSLTSKLSDKPVDPTQSSVSKGEYKSPRKIAEETKVTETASVNFKAIASKATNAKYVDIKNENCSSDASKDAKTPMLVIKPQSKDAKIPPFATKLDSRDTKTPLLATKPESKDTKTPQLVTKPDSKDTKTSLYATKPESKETKTPPLAGKPESKNAKTSLPPSKSDSKETKSLPLANKLDSKDAKSPMLFNKPDGKDLKLVNGTRSKTPSFGKDSLKNIKDTTKQIKSPDPEEHKTNSSHIKDNGIANILDSSKGPTNTTPEKAKVIPSSKSPSVKLDRGKQQDRESTPLRSSTKLKSAETSPVSNINEQLSIPPNPESAELNKTGHVVKASTKIPETSFSGNNESKETSKSSRGSGSSKREASPFSSPSKTEVDKSAYSKDQGKEKGSERKHETVTNSSVSGKKPLSSTSTIKTSRSSSSLSTDTRASSSALAAKTAENKTSKTLKPETGKESKSPLSSLDKPKFSDKETDKADDKDASTSSVKSPTFPLVETIKTKQEPGEDDKEATTRTDTVNVSDAIKLTEELKDKEEKLEALTEQISKMIQQAKTLEEERDHEKSTSSNNHRKDTETMLINVREQLSNLESQCKTLEKNNQSLIDQLHTREASAKQNKESGKDSLNDLNLEEDLEAAEKELEVVKEANKELQTQIMEMKCEMDEMYDHFRENEHEEFRELQTELDLTAKTCRILQFKLRKAERRNEQFEEERMRYEEKLRMLQDQFESKDAKTHIRILEEELRVAKEVSVRLHDELDIIEDKRNKALDDNRHLTDLLEHTDRRQFRLEMEIDKLRDIVAELKQQLAEAKSRNTDNNNYTKELSPNEKVHSTIYTRSID